MPIRSTTWRYALAPGVGTIYAGGYFANVGAQSRACFAAFSTFNSDWSVGTGVWSNAANWSPPVVPDNPLCNQFNVLIAGSGANVTLDIDPMINSLTVQKSASLALDTGSLTIVTSEGVTNDASLSVGDTQALIADASMPVDGTQPIMLEGGSLASTQAENLMSISVPVKGFGDIDAAFNSSSTIEANVLGQNLAISGSFSAISNGELRASSGGTLLITRSVAGAGSLAADGGTIDIPGSTHVVVSGSTANVSNGGQMIVAGMAQFALSSAFEIGCGSFRGCTPPVLNVMGSSTTNIGGNLIMSGTVGDITVEPATIFELAGNFDNQCTSPAAFHWETGPLTMNGAAPQTLEAAGQDFGPRDPAGYIDNFAMGTLRIEPGRTVDVLNTIDNVGGAGCEALYVDTLSLGAGSNFQLNGCNAYYNTLIMEPGATIIRASGAFLMSTYSGDLDSDDDLDFDDANQLVDVLLDGTCSPPCMVLADINGDGAIDGLDISLMTRLLTGW